MIKRLKVWNGKRKQKRARKGITSQTEVLETKHQVDKNRAEADRIERLGFKTGAKVRFLEDYDDDERDFHAEAGDEMYVVIVYGGFGNVGIEFFDPVKEKNSGIVAFHEDKLEIIEPDWGFDKTEIADPSHVKLILSLINNFERYDDDHLIYSYGGRRYLIEVEATDVTYSRFYNKKGFKKRVALMNKMFPPYGFIRLEKKPNANR